MSNVLKPRVHSLKVVKSSEETKCQKEVYLALDDPSIECEPLVHGIRNEAKKEGSPPDGATVAHDDGVNVKRNGG